MPVKVSVVVPVYNPGRYIEPCIDSILGQSLPPDEYEAIFVDDGSTDDTPARLDRLAAEHDNVRVIHIPNSGWPGRPRNVGVDAAVGEFVQFVDNDDRLGPDALRRLYEYGVANDADVVIGKMAGQGRSVPRELFRVSRPRATVHDSPLIDSLTPHKMLRRSFLQETGLRFPEGRRRLEDHVFVTEAFLRARNVSVLSDYVCYIHTRRDDTSNAGLQLFDPVGYYANLREALDVVERYTEPGRRRDRLFRRWFRVEMIERLRGRRMLSWPSAFRAALFTEIHKVAAERFGPGVAAGLPPLQQVVAALILADLPDEALELARWESKVELRARPGELRWSDGALRLTCEASMTLAGAPLTLRRDGDAVVLDPPLGEAGHAALRKHGVDLRFRPASAKSDLLLRFADSSAEFFCPGRTEQSLDGPDDQLVLTVRNQATIDPDKAAGGGPLSPGRWNPRLRVSALGWTKEAALGRHGDLPATPQAALIGEPPRVVVPFWGKPAKRLTIDVDPGEDRLAGLISSVRAAGAQVDGGRLRVSLPLYVPAGGVGAVRYVAAGEEHAEVRPAELDSDGTLTADLPAQVRRWAGIDVAVAQQPRDPTGFVRTRLALARRPYGEPAVVDRAKDPSLMGGRAALRGGVRRVARRLAGERGRLLVRRARGRRQARELAGISGDLRRLAAHFKTDKWGTHRHAQHYQRHLEHLRNEPINLLEIGVGGYDRARQGGASLRMWKHFFPNAQIFGVDIEDKSFVDEDRITTFVGDQSDPASLRAIADKIGRIDVVVDDGSHRSPHVRTTFETLFPLLSDGGVYAVEDTQTSYWPEWMGSEDLTDPSTSMGMLKALADGLNHEEFVTEGYQPTYTDRHVVGVHFYHGLVIVEKGINADGSTKRRVLKRRYPDG